MRKRILFVALTLVIAFVLGYFIYTGNNLPAEAV